ncbi:MAG: tetratricopeptide repeat protein [Planctomycetes bacterium]|nr:tetratricopeptide repeat protein [Planctomycetota bacterium]
MNETAASSTPTPRPRRGRLALLCVVVAAAVAAAHWPALSARAVSFDDDQYFVSNGLVRSPSLTSAWRFLSEVLEPSTVNGYYQPLNMISLMLDAAIGATPDNLRPLHRTSLLLHIANTLFIVILLRTLFGNDLIAASLGLLFGLHPMTVETIPWTGERKTLLATFFALCCFLTYLKYTRLPSRSAARKAYTGCTVLFALALMAKPTVTPLPLLLLALDVWPLKRLSVKSIMEKVPLLAIAGVSSVITFISQARTASIGLPTERDALFVPWVVCHNVVFYLWKMICPTGLTSHYAVPQPFDLSAASVRAGVIGTAVLAVVLLVSLRWTRAAVSMAAFYVLGLLPTMQIVSFSNVIASDKYAYLPSIGVLILLAAIADQITRRPRGAWVSVVGMGLVIAASVMEFRGTREYLTKWTDTETLYRHMIALEPRAPTLRSHMGNLLLDLGRVDEALSEHAIAVECAPQSYEAWNDLGNALRASARTADAVRAYERALEIFPDYHVSHRNLGVAMADLGRFAEAEQHFARAVELKPKNPEAYDCWGTVLLQQGRMTDAYEKITKALVLNPTYPDANNHMGIVMASRGQINDAIEHFRTAVELKPAYTEARFNLARSLIGAGRKDEARQELEAVLRLAPGDTEASAMLATLSSRP